MSPILRPAWVQRICTFKVTPVRLVSPRGFDNTGSILNKPRSCVLTRICEGKLHNPVRPDYTKRVFCHVPDLPCKCLLISIRRLPTYTHLYYLV